MEFIETKENEGNQGNIKLLFRFLRGERIYKPQKKNFTTKVTKDTKLKSKQDEHEYPAEAPRRGENNLNHRVHRETQRKNDKYSFLN